jgi:hypothetical protein
MVTGRDESVREGLSWEMTSKKKRGSELSAGCCAKIWRGGWRSWGWIAVEEANRAFARERWSGETRGPWVAMDKILIEKQSSYRTHGRGVDMVPRGRCEGVGCWLKSPLKTSLKLERRRRRDTSWVQRHEMTESFYDWSILVTSSFQIFSQNLVKNSKSPLQQTFYNFFILSFVLILI